jgi:uncharacterized protein (DUF302 family)
MTRETQIQHRNFNGVRVEVDSPLPFVEVRARLLGAMGKAPAKEVGGLADAVGGPEEFARQVQERLVGASGFMLFAEIDHGTWIKIYGINQRSVRLILGNPLIAITMMRHDLNAGLFAPVELLLTEKKDDEGSAVLYVLPSSLIAVDEANAELRAAAQALDAKLDALVHHATAERGAL